MIIKSLKIKDYEEIDWFEAAFDDRLNQMYESTGHDHSAPGFQG